MKSFYATLSKYTLEDAVKNRKAIGKVLFAVPVPSPAVRRAAGGGKA